MAQLYVNPYDICKILVDYFCLINKFLCCKSFDPHIFDSPDLKRMPMWGLHCPPVITQGLGTHNYTTLSGNLLKFHPISSTVEIPTL